MAQQGGFDLLQLDAEAADFDLGIGAAEEFDLAIGQITAKVAGAVEPIRSFVTPRIDPEFGRGFGGIGITAGEVIGTEVDLAHLADAGLFAAFADEDELHPVVTPANRQTGFQKAAGTGGRFAIEMAGAARQHHVGHGALGFGRAVEVDAGGVRRDGVKGVDIRTLEHVADGENPFERRQAATFLGDQLEHGRDQVDQGDAFVGDPRR